MAIGIGRLELIGLCFILLACGNGSSNSADDPEIPPQSQGQPAAIDVSRAQAWILKGDAADLAGNREEALRAYREAAKIYQDVVSRNPGYPALWNKLGSYYWLGDQKDQAIAAYKEALRLQPDNAEAQQMLGRMQESSDGKTSILEYRGAVQPNPSEAQHHLDLGKTHVQNRQFEAAIMELNEASRLNPEDGESHALLGKVRQLMGDMQKAIFEYRKALVLKLTDSNANEVHRSLSNVLKIDQGTLPNTRKYWLSRVINWRMAVDRHVPGQPDASATMIGSWPTIDLETIIFIIKEVRGTPSNDSFKYLAISDVLKMTRLYQKEFVLQLRFGDEPNTIFKKAALLHTDIAMLKLDTGVENAYFTDLGLILVTDGRATPLSGGSHWEFARMLLDSVSPNPSRDDAIRKWYIATTAHMFARRHWAYAEVHLLHAMAIFPSDAKLLFYAGVLHEINAEPRNQNTRTSSGERVETDSKKARLKLAEKLLKRSVEADPRFAEAHLHLGRVIGLLGDHNRAVAELRQAASAIAYPQLQYYCSLYLGNELAKLDRRGEAREQFERAAALYPNAQSPLFALSRLAHRNGDLKNAFLPLQQAFKSAAKELSISDPWWMYDLSHVRDVSMLVAEMQKAFGGIRQ
jgi:tetratricopeptide (TPR) repeat protein